MFTRDPEIIAVSSDVFEVLMVTLFLDFWQNVLSGTIRAIG